MTDKLQTQTPQAIEQMAVSPLTLLKDAVDKDATVEQLGKLMDLNDRWEAKLARKAFFDALAKMQSEMPDIKKTRPVKNKAGVLLYKFADIDAIIHQMRGVLYAYSFSYRFEFEDTDKGLNVSCIATHMDGHSETTTIPVPKTKGLNTNAAQDGGIMQTYGMRYSFCGAFGITTANDDTDGKGQEDDEAPTVKTVTKAQATLLAKTAKEYGVDPQKMFNWAGCTSFETIPAHKFDSTKSRLKANKAEATPEEIRKLL